MELQIPVIPRPSDIRWSYTYDIIHFIKKQFQSLKDYINEKGLNNKIKDIFAKSNVKWINGTEGQFDINEKAFYCPIVGIDEVLGVCQSVNNYFQKTECFVDEQYYIAKKLIDYLFKCLHKSDQFNKSNCRNEFSSSNEVSQDTTIVMDDYIKSTRDIDDKDLVKRINKQLMSHLKRMLHTLMKKFIIINGQDNAKEENPIDVSDINSLEAFEIKADEYNKENLLYQVVKLSVSYMDKNKVIFNGLSDDVIAEYNTLMDYRLTNESSNMHIVEGMKAIGLEHFPNLFQLVLNMKDTMATSACVESLFSHAKNVIHTNMPTQTADENLYPILEVKRGEQVSFPSYNIKFEKVLKHLNFKE